MTADVGFYVDTIGSPSQTKCLPGKYNPAQGSTSVDACIDAEPGFYVQTTTSGAGSQTPCSTGTYQAAFGMTECTDAEGATSLILRRLLLPHHVKRGHINQARDR